MGNRILHHLESRNALHEAQFGFRRHRSTHHAVEKVLNYIRTARQNGKHTLMVSIDYKGAFNHAWWPAILYKLGKDNCPQNLYNLVRSYLTDRHVWATNQGHTLYCTFINRGCPQGSKSGPLLWTILYDSLLELTDSSQSEGSPYIQGYADDTVVLFSHQNQEVLQSYANQFLERIESWSTNHKLIVNKRKSSCMVFPKENILKKKPTIKIGGCRIKCVDTLQYLGLTLDPKLTWTDHIHCVYNKAVRVSNTLRSIARNTWGLSPKNSALIYRAVIEPILTYGAEEWGYTTLKVHHRRKLLSAQRAALIAITKAYRTTSTDALLAIAGLFPVHLVALGKFIKKSLLLLEKDGSMPTQRQNLLTKLKLSDSLDHINRDITTNGIDRINSPKDPHPACTMDSNIYINPVTPKYGVNFYTDGSKTNTKVGASVVLVDPHRTLHWQAAYSLKPHCSIAQAESYAILRALRYINGNRDNFRKVTINIISDSRTALYQLQKENRKLPIVEESLQLIKDINSYSKLNFYWVRGHSGVPGNDRADLVAKKANNIANSYSYEAIPVSCISTFIQKTLIGLWQKDWDSSTTGRVTHDFIPNVNSRLNNRHFLSSHSLTQLLSAHGNFGSYLLRFLGKGDGLCGCGMGEEDDPYHLIFACVDLAAHRKQLRDTALLEGLHWPCRLQDFIDNKKLFVCLTNFVSNIPQLQQSTRQVPN
ncbi:uncharacterized protein, partial [Centruroides vittatus]|uniref:uncharacterized protein n=1 Tax=Centruroides vittatus TaxID=120091 RepID=UPI00350FADDF